MVLNLSLSREAEAGLRAEARAAGLDVATYATRLLERLATRPSLNDVLAPLRDEVEQSITEDELTRTLEQVKHEVRAHQRTD